MLCLESSCPRSDGGGGVDIRAGVVTEGESASDMARFDDEGMVARAGESVCNVMVGQVVERWVYRGREERCGALANLLSDRMAR